jgi:NTP pyrophosphatase (non-canonical NTP hydrolase)
MVISPKIVKANEKGRNTLKTEQLSLLHYIQEIVLELADLSHAADLPELNKALDGVTLEVERVLSA